MQNACKCKACGRRFKADRRNQDRQSFCSRKSCQRQRRTLQQRLRRLNAATRPGSPGPASVAPQGPRRLQAASVISEADIRAENPVIIGLISMLTGTTDLEQIEKTYRQLWLRGMQIICEKSGPELRNPHVIHMFESLKEGASGVD
jgi:hypothetical protein